MEDRANILVKEDLNDSGIYLYTHWSGSDLPMILQKALAKKWRWDDCAYLSRIIFDQMTENSHGEETGYGISTFFQDGDDRILEVNCDRKTISMEEKSWTFQEYIDLPSNSLHW